MIVLRHKDTKDAVLSTQRQRSRGGEVITMDEKSKEYELFERSPVLTAIAKLALPTVAGQIILVIYNMADTFFVGLTGDDAKLTAVTVCMPAFMFLSAVSNLFGVGGASEVSRSLGCRNYRHAAAASAFAAWGCAAVTVLYVLAVWAYMDGFINLLGGAAPGVHAQARVYLTATVIWGGLGTSMNALLAHLVRSVGLSMQASLGIMGGGILNIALDPLFMFGLLPPGNEVLGAGVATALANLAATVYFLWLIRSHRSHMVLSFRPRKAAFSPWVVQNVLSTGFPACVMTLFENVSYAVLDKLMMAHGTALQAGIGVAKKVNMLAHCIVRGMTQGVLPLIAYNYASNNHKRMYSVVTAATVISVALAAVCTGVCLLGSEQLIGVFITTEAASRDYGARFLRILSLGGPFSACAYSIISFFQAVKRGKRSFVLAILRKGVLDIPMMFALGALFPVYGIVAATPLADAACCVVAVVMFARFVSRHPCTAQVPEISGGGGHGFSHTCRCLFIQILNKEV